MDFKDHFNFSLADELAERALCAHSTFDKHLYQSRIPSHLLELEMKQRVLALGNALWEGLGVTFAQASPILCQMLNPIPQKEMPALTGMPAWVIASIVEEKGLESFEDAMKVLHAVTQNFTAEFAIRPFLRENPAKTFAMLKRWTEDESHHVRRLASEGCRPRLPWGTQVPQLLKDPRPVIEILEHLVDDSSEYVRRSVANNMNDISKDHPQLVLDTMHLWKNRAPHNPKLDWIIRHGLRSLARQGLPEALEFLGYPTEVSISVLDFSVTPEIQMGEAISIDCQLQIEQELAGLMIDYAILSPGARGKMNRKVFKWSKRKGVSAGVIRLNRSHTIDSNSSRVYYPGNYKMELIVNGKIKGELNFEVHGER